jgi:uncharacterized protein YqeY
VLRDQINDAVKTAMKSQDKLRLSTLRMVNSAIKNADIEARGAGKGLLPDGDILGLMQKLIKQRQESVELYDKGGRAELADQERTEIEIIKGFLPQQLSEAEAKEAIAQVIQETGAAGMKDMGKVIAALKERHAGRMDFGKASALVKGMLTGCGGGFTPTGVIAREGGRPSSHRTSFWSRPRFANSTVVTGCPAFAGHDTVDGIRPTDRPACG